MSEITVEQIIRLGDDLKNIWPKLSDAGVRAESTSAMPAGYPAYASIKDAVKIFGIGQTYFYELIRKYPDFPFIRLGLRKMLIDVPATYEWMHSHNCNSEPLLDCDEE